jgi:DNA polymerase-3 subunit alpha
MYIVFDTETTGRPKRFNAPWTDADNWPRLVQLAWVEYAKDGSEISRHDLTVKPEGYSIPHEVVQIHGISNEKAHAEGIPMLDALSQFKEALERNYYLIAHNVNFDLGVMGCEFHRASMSHRLATIFPVDTMKLTIDFCKLRGRRGYKFPKLIELHNKLFGKDFTGAHNAFFDVQATAKCFFELQRLGIFGFRELPTDSSQSFSSESVAHVSVTPEEEAKPLVHFSCHTHYSLLRGAGSIDNYLKRAKKLGHTSLCVVDVETMSGSFELWQKAKKYGINPIFGIEVYLNDTVGTEEFEKGGYPIKIIVKNETGFVNLNKLIFLSHSEGFDGMFSRICTDWLIENKEGLIVTTGNYQGYLASLFFKGQKTAASRYWEKLQNAFGDDFVAEIKMSEIGEQKRFNNFVLKMGSTTKTMVIMDNDVHYVMPDDAAIQDTISAVKQQTGMDKCRLEERRKLYYLSRKDYYNLNVTLGYNYPQNILKIFMDNTLKLAERCSFDFEIGVEKYPTYEPTQDIIDWAGASDTETIITKMGFAKLRQKLKRKFEKGKLEQTQEVIDEYKNRLTYEIQIIKDKKMLDYFLVNWEILRDYRKRGFETGSARGSAAGSLLSWCLDITKIDPIQFGLYFERFLNPARNSPPDIDIDFMTGTDEETTDFLYKKYGRERVMSVGTFSKWNEKGCLKDVVRAHRGPEATGNDSDVALITREMPNFLKVEFNLAWWFENHPQSSDCSPLVQRWLTDPANAVIIKQTLDLQGQVRGFGKHAAGVVITPTASWNYLPTNMIVSNKSIVSAYQEGDRSGKDLSFLGILKLDRLKVSTINIIMDCIQMIKNGEGVDLFDTVMNIDEHFDDQNLYDELMLGQNHGIFQFESPGMNALIRGLNVENFEEMAACNALYRPGPMGIGAHRSYIDNKKFPGQIEYPSELIKPILEKTNGVLVFQEQIQFIAKEIAGMDLGEGDNLRRALDKAAKLIKKVNQGEELTEEEKNSKNYKNYEEYWGKFVAGAAANGVAQEEVDKILEYLSEYLGYSFNKSHSVAYAFIAMQTLYLKHYYPTYFYTALLNEQKSSNAGKEKEQQWLTQTITAAMTRGITIKPPTRQAKWRWSMTGPNEITMGFSSISKMGDVAYKELNANLAIKNKKFKDVSMAAFFDTPFTKYNKTSFRVCLMAGMFDDWSSSREYLMFLRDKGKRKKPKDAAQFAMFDMDEISYTHKVDHLKYPATSDAEKRDQFIDVCGFNMEEIDRISTIHKRMDEMNAKAKDAILPLPHYSEEGFYWFVIKDIFFKKTKKGKDFISILASDGIDNVKFNLFAPTSEKLLPRLQKEAVFVGKFKKNDKGFLNYNGRVQLTTVMHAFEDTLLV